MDTLLEAFLDAPDVVKKMEIIENVLTEERERRLRFYEEITPEQKTEFINGEVIMHSPSKLRHTEVSGYLLRLLFAYVDKEDLGLVVFEKTLISLTRNDYEPDIAFFDRGKAVSFTPDQMQFPAPDFIAEILSPSTERNDRRIKKQDYAAHGVGEYWIVDPVEQAIEQYVLHDKVYQLQGIWKGDDPIVSKAIAGFRIPAQAVFEREANRSAVRMFAD